MRILVLALLLFCGCVPTPGPVETRPSVTTVKPWDALADRIEDGKIDSTDELVLIVAQLAKDGDIVKADVDAFDGLRFSRENLKLTEANRGEIAKQVRELK